MKKCSTLDYLLNSFRFRSKLKMSKQIGEMKNTQQCPYNVWSLFTTTFPNINKDDIIEHDVQKYLVILKPLLDNSVSYITTFCTHNRYSENNFKEHEAFVIWLFGQFIGVLLRERYSSQFDSCINVQLRILNLLVNKNGTMFVSVIRHYISALKDLTDTYGSGMLKQFEKGEFNWFVPNELPDSKLSFVNLKYKITKQKVYIRMINHFLTVLTSYIKSVSYSCQDVCPELWSITVKLLEISTMEKSVLYIFISSFVDFCGLPECHKMRYSLLRFIKYQIQIFCTCGKVNNEEEFKSMIDIITRRITPYYSYSNLFSSLSVSSVSIYLNLISAPVILSFLETVLSAASLDDSLYESPSSFDLSDLCLYGKRVERVIMKDIRNAVKQSTTKCLNVFDVSLTWKNTLSKIEVLIGTVKENEDADIWTILSPVYLVSNLASNVSHILHKDRCTCSFFDREIYPLIDTITKLVKNTRVKEQRTLNVFLQIVGNLVTLPEFGINDNDTGVENNRSIEVAIIILSIPWVSTFNIPYNYAGAKDMIFPLCKIYKSFIDLSIQKVCLLYLARMQNSIYCTLRDDYIVKKLVHQYELILPILHVIIHNMSLPSVEFLLQHIMAESDETVNIQFCKLLKPIICSLSQCCYFVRSLVDVWDLHCTLCDKSDDFDRIQDDDNENSDSSGSSESGLSCRIQAQFSQYFVRIMNSSMVEAKYLILKNVRFIFNHLRNGEFVEFLDVCKTCLTGEDVAFRNLFIDNAPYLLFPRRMLSAGPCRSRKSVVYFHEKDLSPTEQTNFENYASYLLSIVRESLESPDEDKQYISMTMVYKIGCVPCKITLFPTIKILIHFLLTATSCYSSCAKFYIEEVAAAHGYTEESIYVEFRDQLYLLMARILLLNYMLHGASIQKVLYKFDYKSVINDATHCHLMKFLILLVSRKPRAMPLLDQLAEIMHTSTNEMLISDFKHIYSNAVLFEKTERVDSVIQIITERTKLTLSYLLSQCYTNVLVLCLVNYHRYCERIQNIIISMHELCNSSTVSSMKDCLESKFLGILLLMEHYLTSANTPPHVKCDILTSFAKLLSIMGTQYITTIRFKVLAILKTMLTLDDENGKYLSIKAWESFIHCIHVDALGPLLSTIFVSLMPFVRLCSELVNEIFHFLIIENKDNVSNYINDLYFVDQSQCSKEVYKQIQTMALLVMEKPIYERLEVIAKWLKHDISEIKLHALKRLQMELSKYRSDMTNLMLATDTTNRVVLQILETLVNGFRDSDDRVQEASGECLGEMGAIDPSYIPYTVKKTDHFPLDVESNAFIIKGLTVLCRGFQSAKSSVAMDNFALSIQEMLIIYEITENDDLWKSMSRDLQEIMSPFRYTTYSLPLNDDIGSNYSHPIYFSRHGRTFHSWAYVWLSYLYTLLPLNNKLKTITHWCKGAISSDDACLLFFLPYIVLQAVLNSNEESRTKIHEEMLIILTYSIRQDESTRQEKSQSIDGKMKNLETSAANKVVKANVIFVKTMFSLIEQLQKAMYEIGSKAEAFNQLKTFLDKFSSLLLAEKAVECGEYARALFYMEDHIKRTSSVGPHISVLSKIYYHLNDTDDLKGVLSLESNKKKQPQDIVLLHEITDQFHDAAICYQKLLKGADEKYRLSYQRKMLRCYLAINQPEVALSFVTSSSSEMDAGLQGIGAEALWSLSQFDKLDEFVNQQPTHMFECPSSLDSLSNLLNESWGIQLGKSILQLLNTDKQSVRREICNVRSTISKLLHVSSISFTDYRESYEYFVKLHILNEFEKVAKLVTAAATDDDITIACNWLEKFNSVFATEFEERLIKLQPTSRVLQPVLNMRQVLFAIAQKVLSTLKPELNKFFDDRINKCWIKRIEIARQTRNFQLAYSNIIEAENYEFKGFYIEKAKYHWDKLEHSEALRILNHGLHHHFPDIDMFKSTPMDENVSDRQLCSETLLLIGIYNDQMANMDAQLNSWYFEKAVAVYKCSEKVLVKLANYKDKGLPNSKSDAIRKEQVDDYITTINYYGKSLDYGCEYIYQSMSRMISIWLDFGQRCSSNYSSDERGVDKAFLDVWKKAVATMCQMMASFAKRLPPYFFFIAFSQITSRMSCSNECFAVLKIIIVICIKNYPDQSLWRFTTFLKSPSSVLVTKCREILGDPELKSLRDVIEKFRNIFAKLSTVCTVPIQRSGKYNLSTLTKESRSFLEPNYYSTVMVPVQKFLNVTLPHHGESYDRNHNPFPQRMAFIHKFREEVQVYSSLQKPKRLSLYGTDGVEYSLMCKSEDDLRLDCRFMEFNTIINTYLKRDVQARERQLYIRTYSVLPLHIKCGIMEFVPNLLTMRESMKSMYACFGLTLTAAQSKELMDKFATKKTLEDRRKYFLEKLLPAYPPILGEWYKRSFPNPGSWYTARSAYMRTLAVMSIVGYVMGLGDRHCDNILLDSSNGDVIHVDFNLVFNTGENLPTPEVVPFRLTHGMVDAMGPLGVEGMFIYTCEITNRVLRNHKEQLISVLSPFLYDPQKWTDKNQSKEEMFRTVQNKIHNLELRLNGVVRTIRTEPSMPLSVEGQTRRLIELATDINNLCSMFYGWGAYM